MIETQMCLEFLLHANKTPNDKQQKVGHIAFFPQIASGIFFQSILEVILTFSVDTK